MTREEAKQWILDHITPDDDTKQSQVMRVVIKALEQQPCEDAVNRQAVNDLVDELARAISDERCCISRGRSTATIMQDILDLPLVTPKEKTGWIPVTERLPEENGCYLVTTRGNYNDIIDIAYYTKGIWHKANKIIAWMPLPKAYKEEKND